MYERSESLIWDGIECAFILQEVEKGPRIERVSNQSI